MPMVIVTVQVQDPVKWEAGFRTHGDLFRKTYTLRAPVHYTIARAYGGFSHLSRLGALYTTPMPPPPIFSNPR